MFQTTLLFKTSGRNIYDITEKINELIMPENLTKGICHLFCQHTSCSLMISENYDDDVKKDIETYFSKAVPDGFSEFEHTLEGEDDMPSHIRTILTSISLSIPVDNSNLILGKWQGVNLYEHRYKGYERKITLTLMG